MRTMYVMGERVDYDMSDGCCVVYDSWLHKGRRVKRMFIREAMLHYEGFRKRSEGSYLREWIAHNALFSLGIETTRTQDTDLDVDEPLIRRIGYFIVSLLFPWA